MEVEAKGLRVDLATAEWQNGSHRGSKYDSSVEVAFVDDAIAVRDSKNPTGPVLLFTQQEWDAFVSGAKAGEFDLD